jgi:predicted membrane-bound spermidine synthase
MNFINTGIFVTGFSASAIEIILIIAFQVVYGYTYQMMGILITFFMAGIFIGSVFLIGSVKIFIRNYSIIQYLIGIFSIVVALVLYFIKATDIPNLLVYIIFATLVTIIGVLTGLQFSLASKIKAISYSRIASSTYASDLFGAAIGAIAVSAFLIPLFGIIKVSLILAILNFITGLYILLKLRSKQ